MLLPVGTVPGGAQAPCRFLRVSHALASDAASVVKASWLALTSGLSELILSSSSLIPLLHQGAGGGASQSPECACFSPLRCLCHHLLGSRHPALLHPVPVGIPACAALAHSRLLPALEGGPCRRRRALFLFPRGPPQCPAWSQHPVNIFGLNIFECF